MTHDRETQLHAIHGSSVWLSSSQTQTDETREFNDELIHVLQIYREELQRQIDGKPAKSDWLNIVAVTSQLALLLKDALQEANPELAQYRPEDEPMTIEEMIMRLLSDAIDHFSKCGRPEALAPISDLVEKVLIQEQTAQ